MFSCGVRSGQSLAMWSDQKTETEVKLLCYIWKIIKVKDCSSEIVLSWPLFGKAKILINLWKFVCIFQLFFHIKSYKLLFFKHILAVIIYVRSNMRLLLFGIFHSEHPVHFISDNRTGKYVRETINQCTMFVVSFDDLITWHFSTPIYFVNAKLALLTTYK